MKKILIAILALGLVLVGCGKKEEVESKNMEQVYQEQGIPVKVETAQAQEFSLDLDYTAKLSGLRETFASAMIGGKIEKIHVKTGDYVKKDDILMEFPEDTPAAQYLQAKSGFELAKSTYEKMQKVYEVGGISKVELDQIKTNFEVARANYDSASQMLKVRAPISGYITNITVNETDNVDGRTVLATVSQTSKLKAKIWATETEINDIKKGQKTVAIWNGKKLEGKVSEVGLAIDPMHNAFGIDIVFDNKDNMIPSGVLADIKINVYKNENAFIVSRENVKKDSKGMYIYLVKNEKAQKQYVETGKENGSFEILNGVGANDKIIVEGLNLVYPDAKVNIIR